MQPNKPPRIKQLFIVLSVIVGMLLLWWLVTALSHTGKIAVTIDAYPSDQKITANGKEISDGTVHLKPGKYTFVGTKKGFENDEQIVNISENNTYVALVPRPVSEDAINWAKDARVQTRREELAGRMAQERGSSLRTEMPFINLLPRTDPSGPYLIDFGYRTKDIESVYFIVKYSTPDGRTKAIQWLKENGADLKNLDIIFEDYYPPYEKGVS